MFNREIVKRTLALFKTGEVEVDMDLYLIHRTGGDGSLDSQDFAAGVDIPRCNTAACYIGHVALTAPDLYRDCVKRSPDYYAAFDLLAEEALGVHHDYINNLFIFSRWPTKYQNLGQWKGAIAITQKALHDGSFEFLWRGE
jgi:hypothetical protein